MINDPAFKNAALRYWERRRVVYNLVLIPPSLIAYMLMAGLCYAGDPHETHGLYVSLLFALSALGANVCYTFAYAVEFLLGNTNPTSRWMRFGRASVFAAGMVLSVLLALIGGHNIALMEFYYR